MCDYVFVLHSTDESLQSFVAQKLAESGLQVTKSGYPSERKACAFVIHVPDHLVQSEAESWGFLKRDEKGFKREYVSLQHDLFEPPYTASSSDIFTPSEVSFIAHEIIKRIKVGEVPDFFPRPKSGVLPHDSLMLALGRVELGECWPLHAPAEERFAAWKVGPSHHSFSDHMEHYFGPNVALYFAWLKNYIVWLVFPAVAGLAVFTYHYLHPEVNVDNSLVSPLYTIFTIIWSVLFVKSWDRRSSSLICGWGITSVKWRREVRPGFTGMKRISPVTGLPERHFSPWNRLLRYLVSSCVTALMLVLAFSVMVISLNLQGYIHPYSYSRHYLLFPSIAWLCDEGEYFDPAGRGPLPSVLLYVPVILHVLIIQVLNRLYQTVAEALTEWENHRSPAHHENALFVKRFFFEAFDCYIALFYLAFVEKDIVLLRRELVSLYTVDSLRRLATETLIPLVTRKAGRQLGNDDSSEVHPRLEKDYDKPAYEQFDDYLEMVVQLGYVSLFAGAFPLAAPLSLLCNLLELYSDVFKLSSICRRPVVHRITCIGVWSTLVRGTVLLSVFTNLYIFCFTSEQLLTYAPSLFTLTPLPAEEAARAGSDHVHDVAAGAGMTVAGVMAVLEHGLLAMVAALWLLIPDEPAEVTEELARREYEKFLREHDKSRVVGVSVTN